MITPDVEKAKETLIAARDVTKDNLDTAKAAAQEKVDSAKAAAQEKVDAAREKTAAALGEVSEELGAAADMAKEAAEKASAAAQRKIKSLKSKLNIRMAAGFVIFTVLVIGTVGLAVQASLTPYFKSLTMDKAAMLQNDLGNKKIQINNQAKLFTSSSDFQNMLETGNKYELASYLSVFSTSVDASACYYTDEKGKVLYSSYNANNVTDFGKEPLLERAQKAGKGTGYTTYNNKVYMLSVIRTIFGDKTGYVVVEKELSSNANVKTIKELIGCDVMFLVGDYVAGSSVQDEDMKNIVGYTVSDPLIQEAVNADDSVLGKSSLFKGSYNTVVIPLGSSTNAKPICIAIGQDLQTALHTQQVVVTQASYAVLFGIILFIIVANLTYGRLIFKPIEKAYKAIHQLADESDVADLTYRVNVTGDDEIGALCQDIDIFLERQQNLVGQLMSAQTDLQSIGSTLGTTSVESASAISQIMANIHSIGQQTDNQMECLTTANQEIQGNEQRITSLDKMIEEQSAGIIESSAAIEQMIGNISSVSTSVQKMGSHFKELVTVTAEGQTKQTEVDTKVTQMSEQSRLLIEANSVIARIASQTNLLAMNAAIEAAHAGEAGAGFSVVADEIRNLAENSSKQSHNISQELKQINKTITEVVDASTQSREAFRTITDKLTDTDNLMNEIGYAMAEQDNASKQVLEALKDVNTSTSQVQATGKDMKAGSDRVMDEMEKLTQVAETVMGSMNEMSAGASQINAAAQEVSNMAIKTQDNIDIMDGLLKRFKV